MKYVFEVISIATLALIFYKRYNKQKQEETKEVKIEEYEESDVNNVFFDAIKNQTEGREVLYKGRKYYMKGSIEGLKMGPKVDLQMDLRTEPKKDDYLYVIGEQLKFVSQEDVDIRGEKEEVDPIQYGYSPLLVPVFENAKEGNIKVKFNGQEKSVDEETYAQLELLSSITLTNRAPKKDISMYPTKPFPNAFKVGDHYLTREEYNLLEAEEPTGELNENRIMEIIFEAAKEGNYGVLKFGDRKKDVDYDSFEKAVTVNKMANEGIIKLPNNEKNIPRFLKPITSEYFPAEVVFMAGDKLYYATKEQYEQLLEKIDKKNKIKLPTIDLNVASKRRKQSESDNKTTL